MSDLEAAGVKDKTNPTLAAFDALWMAIYSKLGELCVDPRPAVRKSAGQTLFTTIAAHGVLLQQTTWQIVLWQVGGNVYTQIFHLTLCGLVMTYGDVDLGQHWFR